MRSIVVVLVTGCFLRLMPAQAQATSRHVFEIQDVQLAAENRYDNPYVEVECWLELQGPGFSRRIHGFWNGGNKFVVRVVATKPGRWTWRSFSNRADAGLERSGSFEAVSWSDAERAQNPNRRGIIRATSNGSALEYADGSPFFMLADTWWAASTWRFPLSGREPAPDYVPAAGISFEEAVAFRKKQGYNAVAMIAAFPNWAADEHPPQSVDANGVGLRQAWEKNGTNTAKDMHDEQGNRPFASWGESEIVANFDRLNPAYFQSLDRKMQHLHDQGFVTFLETVRRDHGPSWQRYFDWPESYARYVQYIVARYGAYNLIFSGIHLDWINAEFSLDPADYSAALTYHRSKYGGLPYGQPHTILIDGSTYRRFGHGADAPWLTMHAVGNFPRNHGFYPLIEELFALEPRYPVANLEPYYPGWNHGFHNRVAGELPEPNSERDNYFARAQMYGSVLSGALAGHVYGTGNYDGNSTGEPKGAGDRPYIWEGLMYSSGAQLQHLGRFILSEGAAYQACAPRRALLSPHRAAAAHEQGLDGWAFLLASAGRELAFLYFETKCELPRVTELLPRQEYELHWFDPLTGTWLESYELKTDSSGTLALDRFPDSERISIRDWALKLKVR